MCTSPDYKHAIQSIKSVFLLRVYQAVTRSASTVKDTEEAELEQKEIFHTKNYKENSPMMDKINAINQTTKRERAPKRRE